MTVEAPGLSQDAKAILVALHEMQADARRETDAKFESLQKEMLAVSASVKTGFPDGDYDGHRRYHELVIEREEQRRLIRREVITHLLKGSTWAMLVGLIWMLVRNAKDYLK